MAYARETAYIGISMLNPLEGEKLAAALRFIEQRGFEHIHVGIADTLMRHDLAAFRGQRDAGADLAESREMGNKWRTENQPILDAAVKDYEAQGKSIPIQIHHWDEWRHHPDFNQLFVTFCRMSDVDYGLADFDVPGDVKSIDSNTTVEPDLARAVSMDAGLFVGRVLQRGGHKGKADVLFDLSRILICEELAVFTLQGIAIPAIKLYPQESLNSAALIRRGGVPNAPFGMQGHKHVRIKFERIEVPEPSLISTKGDVLPSCVRPDIHKRIATAPHVMPIGTCLSLA